MDLFKLGEVLKNKRNDLNLNLRDAGELIGISHNYLSILEKAKDPRTKKPIKPTIDTLKLISDAYNLNVNDLLSLAGYEDIIIKKANDEIETIAAHHDGDEFTEEELEEIQRFKEFVKSRRNK